MVSAIMTERAAGEPTGGTVKLALNEGINAVLSLPERTVTLSELQRLKRQFVAIHKKAITLGTTEKGAVDWEEENIANKFAVYIEENILQ